MEAARSLLDKLSGCAEDNGAPLSSMTMWRRIEREVPPRQAQIALPAEGMPAAPAAEPSR